MEFVALMALMTSMVALSIDAMLPALPQMGSALGVQDANDRQLVVSVLFLGLAVVLYMGVAISESTRSFAGPIPIEVLNAPVGGAVRLSVSVSVCIPVGVAVSGRWVIAEAVRAAEEAGAAVLVVDAGVAHAATAPAAAMPAPKE
mgnify:CR=1 FL=1